MKTKHCLQPRRCGKTGVFTRLRNRNASRHTPPVTKKSTAKDWLNFHLIHTHNAPSNAAAVPRAFIWPSRRLQFSGLAV